MDTIWFKLLEIVIYVAIGIMFCLIGYKAIEFQFRKDFKLTEEVDNHNKAVGIMLSGMFIAIGIIMSGVL
ncbi:MAG: DUF350 domain-containing protein [Ruminococcus sp.]|jgi:uncharacterized membrane protein YjfL (UPF0719 family)|nr:DUF350 domain-containing protein [Ruminococcus sp.]